MHKVIKPFRYKGSIKINSSKSIYQRCLALSCFSSSDFIIVGDSNNDDVKTAKEICKKIGLDLKKSKNNLIVSGEVLANIQRLNVNTYESGLSLRVFGVLLTSFFENVTLKRNGTAINRKFDFSSLKDLGVTFYEKESSIILNGKLNAGTININKLDSSQLLTGLLITLPFLNGNSIIKCKDLVSRPYIDITLSLLDDLGIQIKNNNYKEFVVEGNQELKRNKVIVEGDWSSAAFHLVGAAISGSITINGLNLKSLQGDKEILNVLEKCGTELKIKNNSVTVIKKQLKSFSFDATQTPDLFPPLVALASCCDGISKIFGVDRLINKESNRGLTLKEEFSKLGIKISLDNKCLSIEGKSQIKGAIVDSHNDHRLAMALSVMASVSEHPITIKNSYAVAKSYSKFYDVLNTISDLNLS